MAEIDRKLANIQEKMRVFQEEQENQLLNLRTNYQETINQVINEAKQGTAIHRESLERKYLAAYEDVERQLRREYEGVLKQVESELEFLRNETDNKMEEAKRQLLENTNLVESFQQKQKESWEREKEESQQKMKDAESSYDQLIQNGFANILYGDVLLEYKKTRNKIRFYFEKEFYQTVVALSLSLLRECNIKNYEIKLYMDKYARRILALKEEAEKYRRLLEDTYKKADLYGEKVCEKHKFSQLEPEENFIDFWSYGIYGHHSKRLREGIAFLEEHGIRLGEEPDADTVLKRITATLSESSEEKKMHLINYINKGDIIVYDQEKMIRDEWEALKSEKNVFGTALRLYNERLKFEEEIDKKLLQYQYFRVEDEKKNKEGDLDCRIGISLKYKNEEGNSLEICIISVRNNQKKNVENQIAIVVDYTELGILAEQYVHDRKEILREVPLIKRCVMEACGDIQAPADTKYTDIQRRLYDKCNPYGRG